MSNQAVNTPVTIVPVFPSVDSLNETHKTTASKIRFLRSLQETENRGQIAKHLGIKYQWVRNVLLTPVKVSEEVSEESTED